MPIFIAKTYNGEIENIVLAKTKELADAYWQGKGAYPHSITIRTEKDLDGHITGVLPILNTKEVFVHNISSSRNLNKKIRIQVK